MGSKPSKSLASPLPCLLAQRADDELRSIMQMLRGPELLKFARCSQQLRRAANSPTAFLYAVFPMAIPRMHFDSDHHPLVRHAAVSLTSNGYIEYLPDVVFPMRIFELDLSEWAGRDAYASLKFLPVLALPTLQHLRVLRWDSMQSKREMSAELVAALSVFSHLHTLICFGSRCQDFALLPTFPALTSLQLGDSYRTPALSLLPLISGCPRLQRLSLLDPCICDTVGEAFLSSACVSRLQFLELDYFPFTAITRERWDKAFASMRALTELRVSRAEGIHELLESVVAAPVLRLLRVQPISNGLGLGRGMSPEVPSIEALLTSCPSIHFVLRLSPATADNTVLMEARDSAAWDRMREAYGDRFEVQIEGREAQSGTANNTKAKQKSEGRS